MARSAWLGACGVLAALLARSHVRHGCFGGGTAAAGGGAAHGMLEAGCGFAVPPRAADAALRGLASAGPARGRGGAATARPGLPLVSQLSLAPVVAPVAAAWTRSGLGPTLLALWAKLCVYWPFTWVNSLALWVMNAPKIYRYYLLFSFGNSLMKWLLPGLHGQLVTGTWLGILRTAAPPLYTETVSQRLKQLLIKQAGLRSGGQAGVSQEVLDGAVQRLKDDPTLLDALGSTSALRLWPRLEKMAIDDPGVLSGLAPDSQAAWIVEALRAGFLEDTEAAASEAKLLAASKEAARRMKALSEAVDTAGKSVKYGVFSSEGSITLKAVEFASTRASEALQTLEQLKAASVAKEASKEARAQWFHELSRLHDTHAAVPSVAAELQRLEDMTV